MSLSGDENCDEALNAFATVSAAYTSCAIANSRPITYCENCVEIFIDVLNSYRNLSIISEGNSKCIDNFVNLDRLQIIETIYRNSYILWNRAKCNECFQFENSTLTTKISKETSQFHEYYEDFVKCFKLTNSSNLCPVCLEKYTTLNNYYTSISNENEKIGVCMDIVDIMNTTRRNWSKSCCKYRKHSEHIFLVTTLLIFVVTAIFYLLTCYFGEKKIPYILQQSRFAESLNHVHRSLERNSEVT
ncbi:hypothetical protein WA026_006841 [Henosepilachna vigintioctopunctata]